MNAVTIVGLLCIDDTFRDAFFKEKGKYLDDTLKQIPLLLSWGDKQALMAIAQDPEAPKAFGAVATAMRKVGCPNSPCLYVYYNTLNAPPVVPPGPGPASAQQK